jgi:single-stranded-DNA-specific exonuclease
MSELLSSGSPRIVRRPLPDQQNTLPAELHPILRRIYLARHVTDAQQLERSLHSLLPYQQLKGIDTAVRLLAHAIAAQQRIVIVADFDADGATSCSVAVRALHAMGARQVDFIVPNRFEYGYGLTPEIVTTVLAKSPDVLVTVDNGISSIDGVAAAKQLGMTVIVTDHHLPGKTLPNADAIVNPNQPGCEFPSKHLAGVGVIFYVMLALRAYLREQQWFAQQGITEPVLANLLDLVALGTVADVVTLDHNNRILVSQGLARIRAQQACPGIVALLTIAGRQAVTTSTMDLGFCVAPRLNAAGRLDDMSIGINCLLSDSGDIAAHYASTLDKLNHERRAIEATMRDEAMQYLQQLNQYSTQSELPYGLCFYDPNWHEGVIGIVAGRMKDRLHRPVIVFAPSRDGNIKGSARSIPGLHIRDVLDSVAAQHPHLLTKFGGHAMAAGLTLRQTDFAEFSRVFDAVVRQHIGEEELQHILMTDGDLAEGDLDLRVAEILRQAGPWGQGFPEPRFDGIFDVVTARIVGERHLKLTLRPIGGKKVMDAIQFNVHDIHAIEQHKRVKLVYRLDINEYQGVRSTQLMVEHLQTV